jgi:photosystem II stability/assembly factor-like uncharacterized protein
MQDYQKIFFFTALKSSSGYFLRNAAKDFPLIIIIYFSVLILPARGQSIFRIQNPEYSPESVNSIVFSGNTGWCAGNSGIMLKTNDGLNWSGRQLFSNHNYRKILIAGNNTIYILTDSSLLYKTTDGGSNWVSRGGIGSYATDISFADESTGYSLNGSKFGKTTDGGGSWVFRKPDTAMNFILYGIFALNSHTVFLSTKDPVSSYTCLLKSTDGGDNWIVFNTYIDEFEITKIFFRDELNGWFAGNRFEKLFSMKTTDGGNDWNVGTIPMDYGNPNNIQFSGSSAGIMTTQYGIYTTADSGLNWVKRMQGFGYTASYLENDSLLFAADIYGRIYKVNTSTFQVDTVFGRHNITLMKIQVIQPDIIWANGLNNTNWKTSNGGENWIYDGKTSALGIKSVFFSDANTGFGITGRGTIRKTTDFGNTWPVVYDTTAELESVYFINKQTGWIFGKKMILRSNDGGLNWSIINSAISLSQPKFFTESRGVAYNNDGVNITTDGGYTWISSAAGNVAACYFINQNTGWVISSTDTTSTILKTTDGGYNFNYLTKLSGTTDNIKFTDANTGYLSGRKIVYRTTNSGVNWNSTGLPVSENIRIFSMDIFNYNTGWLCGDNSTIIKIVNGSLINPNGMMNQDFRLYGNFPNPFNPATKIRYGLSRDADIEITVYDITGKRIRVLAEGRKQAGEYEETFDGRGLSSGIYFCVLAADDGRGSNISTFRMVLLK